MKPITILWLTVTTAVVAVGVSALSLQLALSDTCTATTITMTRTYDSNGVNILKSVGSCGGQENPSLDIVERVLTDGGYIVTLLYREGASSPCYKHHLAQAVVQESYPPRVVITLELEPTSDICILCLGIVETRLLVGPYPAGTVIDVNGLNVVV